jgi:hypothetical protein
VKVSGPSLFGEDPPKSASISQNPPISADSRPTGKPTPTFQLHYCCAPDCWEWGSFGMFSGNIAASQWWCRMHVPGDFLPKGVT